MALSPIAFIPPGCSLQCPKNVHARPTSFAYASADSIHLFKVDTKVINSLGTPAADHGAATPAAPQQVNVPFFPLQALFGQGITSTISAFDYNDELMACLCPASKQVHMWKVADAESVTAKKIPHSLSTMFKKEGAPSTMCVAGKYHILCGTGTGRLISLNTSTEGAEPKCVTIPPPANGAAAPPPPRTPLSPSYAAGNTSLSMIPAATPVAPATSSSTAVEGVTCIAVSPARADIIAAGTSDGTVSYFTLNASTGLHASGSFYPFPPSSKEKDRLLAPNPLPITTMAFDPNNQNQLVVASAEGGLALCDFTNASAPTVVFDWKEKVSGVAWIPGEAGSFYTVSNESNCVHRWSTSSRTPIETFAPAEASAGILGIGCIDKDRVVLTLTSGAVKVFHKQSRQTEFDTQGGHTDSVLACRASRHDRDLIASSGVDGVIRVWNTRSMRLQYQIEVGQVMVYSVDWSNNGKYLIAALGSGELVQYTCSTRRQVWRTSVFPDMIHRVVWSTADSNVIVACSRTGVAVLSKDGQVIRRIATPAAVHSVDIDPSKGKTIAVGCYDHRVYVYNLSSTSDKPVLKLSGHTDVVSDLAYNPSAPQFLLSGSYDGTMRMWDVSSSDSHTASVNSRQLKGHTDRVRSVAWCSLAPYLALSGSADCTIRLWDIRNGITVSTVRGHAADVCAITSNVDRPLIFWSAGKDGAFVGWSLTLLRQVFLQAALGALEQCIVADPVSLMTIATPGNISVNVVCGAAVNKLNKELKECSKPADRMDKLLGFFDAPQGTADLAHLTNFALDPNTFNADAKSTVLPNIKLAEVIKARAKQKVEKAHGRSVAAVGPAYRKERLIEAAEEVLRVGQIEEYCNLLMEAEEWDRAIAVAPAISRDYWRGVCLKAADTLEKSGDIMKAVAYYIIAEESARAARLLAGNSTSSSTFDAATVIAQSCPQRNADAAATMEPAHQTSIDTTGVSATAASLQQSRWNAVAQSRNPRVTAAALVANGSNDEAVRALAYAGEVSPAYLLVHTVPLREQSSIDMAFHLAMLQYTRLRQWDEALACAARQSNGYHSFATLLALFQNTLGKQLGKVPSNSFTAAGIANLQAVTEKLKTFYDQVRQECQKLQLPFDAAAIQQRHANDGMSSQNQIAAMVLSADPTHGAATSAAVLQSIHGFVESLMNVVLQDADGANAKFYLQQAYNVLGYVALPIQVPGNVSPSTSIAGSSPAPQSLSGDHKRCLALCYLVAAVMCVKVYRFPTLLNAAFTKAKELSQGDAALDALANKVQGVLGTYSPHSQQVECCPAGAMLPALGVDGRVMTSVLTGQPLTGAVHTLEDGTSMLSKEEALGWSLCCHFSPLATGARLVVL